MANILRKWKRFMAVGCSHGNHINPIAAEAVIKFRESWKPTTVVHLGDFCDTAAFRSGSKGTSDESEPIGPDIDAGCKFLQQLRPTMVLNGNHEIRIWKLQDSTNAIVSDCAMNIVSRLQKQMKALKADYEEGWSIHAFRKLGNYKLMHGYIFNENSCRDMAETEGNIIFAHTHRAGMAKGRRSDSPTGVCVGTLSNISNMDYALARRATHAWSGGVCFGEYCDDRLIPFIYEQPQTETEWRLPT